MNTPVNTNPENALPDAGANAYMPQQTEAPSQASLDAGAPSLASIDSQGLNKKVLGFIGGVAILMVAALSLLLYNKSSSKEPKAAPRQERAEAPQGPITPPLPTDVSATQKTNTAAIELAQSSALLPPMPELPGAYAEPIERGPSLMERRTLAEPTTPQPSLLPLDALRAQQQAAQSGQQATSAQFLNQPDTLLLRGSYIRCALEARLITDVNGFTSCVVTEPVYSVNGRRLLLPKGSKVFGQYGTGAIRGERVAVIWDRVVTPTGIDVSMASPGVDNLGSAGHPGQYDAHWGQRISSALFISLLSDAFKYYGEKEGPTTATVYPGTGAVVQQPFESNTARTVQQLANQAVQASGNRPPTVTVNQGTIVNIYVSQDVDFSGVLRQ